MATITSYHTGGYSSVMPAQNRAEQWTNATQAGDATPTGYTTWDAQGGATTRALTAAESAMLAAQDTASTNVSNQTVLQQKAQNALTANATFLALASPTNAQVVAQVQAITKECSALIRLLLGQLDSTVGT